MYIKFYNKDIFFIDFSPFLALCHQNNQWWFTIFWFQYRQKVEYTKNGLIQTNYAWHKL